MYVRFWGTRGSIATPGPQTAHYGGNTSCVEVRADDGTLLILDCGTGARELGLHLLQVEPRPLHLHLLIGHTHWDHIQGFPFFDPAFLPDTELSLYAPHDVQRSLEEALAGQMQYPYFPVKLDDLRSHMHYIELEEGAFDIGDIHVETRYLNHTAPTMAYRLSSAGTTLAYVTDHEPFGDVETCGLQHPGDQHHIEFLRGADLIIHDAQYTPEEYRHKVGWGHSTIDYAMDVALAAGAARLALFHHDPGHTDETMRSLERAIRARAAGHSSRLEVFAAVEGQTLQVHGQNPAAPVVGGSALQRRPIAGRRVMLIGTDDLQAASIAQSLSEDALLLTRAADRSTALTQAATVTPDLIIIDQPRPDGDGAALIRTLRTRLERPELPVILLIDSANGASVPRDGLSAPTDYLAAPLSWPMLRTRVRAWLVRTLPQPDPGADGNPGGAKHV
jgi:phosphoribosyl 1,2-cyclic phosphodiesterase